VFSAVATFTENKRRLVVVKLGDMAEHERDTGAAAALAASAGRADPSASDLLQRVAAEDAATITVLLASSPRLRRVLAAPSFEDGGVRAAWCAADAGGSSHVYIFAVGRQRREAEARPERHAVWVAKLQAGAQAQYRRRSNWPSRIGGRWPPRR
jgi:hypothetical protein